MSKIMELAEQYSEAYSDFQEMELSEADLVFFKNELQAEVSRVEAELAALKAEKLEREKQEPVAYAIMQIDGVLTGSCIHDVKIIDNENAWQLDPGVCGDYWLGNKPLYLASGAGHTALLQMLATRARNFPSYPIGQHIPEVFATLGETPPEPGAGSVPMTSDEIEDGFCNAPMQPQALGAYDIWSTAVAYTEAHHKIGVKP